MQSYILIWMATLTLWFRALLDTRNVYILLREPWVRFWL